MDFTAWVESLKSLAQLLAGLGLVTIVLAYVKHVAERRCWENYKRRVAKWIDELTRVHEIHPNELTENQWRYEIERLLTESYFGPLQIQQLLETAVIVARGMADEKLVW